MDYRVGSDLEHPLHTHTHTHTHTHILYTPNVREHNSKIERLIYIYPIEKESFGSRILSVDREATLKWQIGPKYQNKILQKALTCRGVIQKCLQSTKLEELN